MFRLVPLALAATAFVAAFSDVPAPAQEKSEEQAIRDAVTLYASFDEEVKADKGGGDLTLSTRKGDLKKKEFTFEKGVSKTSARASRSAMAAATPAIHQAIR